MDETEPKIRAAKDGAGQERPDTEQLKTEQLKTEATTRKTAEIDVAPPEPRVDDLTPSTGDERSKITRRQE